MATVTVTLVKDCWIDSVNQTAGSSVTVERSRAAELISSGIAAKPANWESSTSGGSEVFAQADPVTGKIGFLIDGVWYAVEDAPVAAADYHALISARSVDKGDATILDKSGKGKNATLGAQCVAATVYGEAGTTGLFVLAASGSSNEQTLNIPAPTWDATTQSLVIACRIKAPAPASNDVPWLGTGLNSTTKGFKLLANTSGQIKINVYRTSDGTLTAGGYSTKALLDGNEHWFCMIFDAGSNGKTVRLMMDGAIIRSDTFAKQNYTADGAAPLRIGGVSATQGIGGNFGDIHVLVFDGGIPENFYSALASLRANPTHTMTSEVQ